MVLRAGRLLIGLLRLALIPEDGGLVVIATGVLTKGSDSAMVGGLGLGSISLEESWRGRPEVMSAFASARPSPERGFEVGADGKFMLGNKRQEG